MTAYKVKKNLGSPVLFRQVRPGLYGQPFEMLKFRSMKDATDEQGNELPDSERLTDFGKRLRDSSLDELPGLWNVIKGICGLWRIWLWTQFDARGCYAIDANGY